MNYGHVEPEPLLSVIIPTRNRLETLIPCVRAALAACPPDCEIVVLDTSDSSLESEIRREVDPTDPRFRYHYTAPPLTFSQTFSAAANLANGQYVTIIGDDDGVLAAVFTAARWAAANNIDTVSPSNPAFYNWPNFAHRHYGKRDADLLGLRAYDGKVSYLDLPSELRSSAQGGFQNFDRLPRIYYGLARRACLEQLRATAGDYFFGSSPDISGAVGLANVVDRAVVVNYPMFLPGSSANSGAGRSGMKKHVGTLEDTPQTAPFANSWPAELPRFYSVQTVWAHAALETLRQIDTYDVASHFGVGNLHALSLAHNPQYARQVVRSLCRQFRVASVLHGAPMGLQFIYRCVSTVLARARGLIFRASNTGYYGYVYEVRGLGNIAEACTALETHMRNAPSPTPWPTPG